MNAPVPGIRIDAVTVNGRHRKDPGDIGALAASIRDVGLLAPIVITPAGRLVAGQRRLEACRRLGWAAIPAITAVSLDSAAALLRAERDENTCRKAMLPSELAALGAALHDLEAAAAKQRQRDHGGTAPGRVSGTPSGSEGQGEARDAVGAALGMAGRTWSDLRYAHRIATDPTAPPQDRELAAKALAAMDAGAGITAAGRQLRHDIAARETGDWIPGPADRTARAHRRRQELAAGWDADGLPAAGIAARLHLSLSAVYQLLRTRDPEAADSPVPAPGDKTPAAGARRLDIIRDLAGRSYTSRQIAGHLGITAETVRRRARAAAIRIPADEAIGRDSGQDIDSARIIRETVTSLEGLDLALALVAYGELDPADAGPWAASLGRTVRVLARLHKRLKEIARA